MARKFEIIAIFPNGKKAKVETHKNIKTAQAAVDAMNNKNKNDLALGAGFPQGVPTYNIMERQVNMKIKGSTYHKEKEGGADERKLLALLVGRQCNGL